MERSDEEIMGAVQNILEFRCRDEDIKDRFELWPGQFRKQAEAVCGSTEGISREKLSVSY